MNALFLKDNGSHGQNRSEMTPCVGIKQSNQSQIDKEVVQGHIKKRVFFVQNEIDVSVSSYESDQKRSHHFDQNFFETTVSILHF